MAYLYSDQPAIGINVRAEQGVKTHLVRQVTKLDEPEGIDSDVEVAVREEQDVRARRCAKPKRVHLAIERYHILVQQEDYKQCPTRVRDARGT